MATPRIVQVEISSIPRPKPAGLLDPTPVVTATFDDGSRKELFSFYPDEIRFDEGELVGLTESQAHLLWHVKDVRLCPGSYPNVQSTVTLSMTLLRAASSFWLSR